ncbi:hypothetical protein P171DRAFT_483263 [Karstenula rhodostoma CBS 690.94]|uniref:Uncharacterized protein n=1 Tax=Karstenula rhodostoma CBS 690.94 TaxID=1392251 RepID=A0A9P4UEK7_9PLEO|nr:hypothetical protein P171DRAFT_483263 [Karstenula rhodostoma CBS 690.94]
MSQQSQQQTGTGAGQQLSKKQRQKQRKKLANEANKQKQAQGEQKPTLGRRQKKLRARQARDAEQKNQQKQGNQQNPVDGQGEADKNESAKVSQWVKALKLDESVSGEVVSSQSSRDDREVEGDHLRESRIVLTGTEPEVVPVPKKASVDSSSASSSSATPHQPAILLPELSNVEAPLVPLVDIVRVAAGTKPFVTIMVPLFPSEAEKARVKRSLDIVFGLGWASGADGK